MPLSYRLQVDSLHNLYIEEQGNPQGVPILFLHGGPGTGLSASSSRYFDPLHYRIILFDQRGAGRSTPFGSTERNTTWELIADIEQIRQLLRIERWILFGGSWGSTLALAYAQSFPDRVLGMIVRGIFLGEQEDLDWLFYTGAPHIWPREWQEFVAPIPPAERSDLLEAYHRRVHHPDLAVSQKACQDWTLWEARNLTLMAEREALDDFYQPERAVAIAKIELHYFRHRAFLEPGQLLKGVDKLAKIPVQIVHGRYDTICPFSNAWRLHQLWPGSQLIEVEGAGHAALEPAIYRALRQATEAFKRLSP